MDAPVFVRIFLKVLRNLYSWRPSCSIPGLIVSLVISGGPLSNVCGVPEEVLGWAEIFARYPLVFGRNFLEGPRKSQS